MHIYLIKSRITNNIVHVFGASDNDDAINVMENYYHYVGSEYYLEHITSYITEEIYS